MNAEEGTSMAKMAVSVLLVVLIIGAVVGIVYAAYSWFNSGTNQLSETVNGITSSMYSNYDNMVVKGSDVVAALKNFSDKDIAVLVSNMACGGYTAAAVDATTGEFTKGVYAMNYCAQTITADATSTDKAPTIPASAPEGAAVVKFRPTPAAGATKTALDGHFIVKNVDWDSTTGLTRRNTNFSPTSTSSDGTHYVKPSASFFASLVYSEETGDVCGILFMQQN